LHHTQRERVTQRRGYQEVGVTGATCMYCILEFGKLCRHLAQPKRLEGFPRRNESSMNEVQEKKKIASKRRQEGHSWQRKIAGAKILMGRQERVRKVQVNGETWLRRKLGIR